MDPRITFETTRLPNYKRGIMWYIAFLSAFIAFFAYFILVDYSPISFTAMGISLFVYYFLVFKPTNPQMRVSFFTDGIRLRRKFISYKDCHSYTFLRQSGGRPGILILFAKGLPHLIPLPKGAKIVEIDRLLHNSIPHKAKTPFIYRLCHKFKF